MGYFEEVGFQVPKRGVDFNLDITAKAHSLLDKYTSSINDKIRNQKKIPVSWDVVKRSKVVQL